MKIQFLSDLHLELADNSRYLQQHPLPVTGDVLLLAGDTIYLEQEHLMKHPFWQWASENYKQVIAVPGNHEYYAYYDLASVAPSRRWELFPNVHICSNTVEHLPNDIDIICSTLWEHIDLKTHTILSNMCLIFIASCLVKTDSRLPILIESMSSVWILSRKRLLQATPKPRLFSPTMFLLPS